MGGWTAIAYTSDNRMQYKLYLPLAHNDGEKPDTHTRWITLINRTDTASTADEMQVV